MIKVYRIFPQKSFSAIVGYADSVFKYGSAKVAKALKH